MALICSECGEEYSKRGFHSHNKHMHGGEAELVDPDDPDDGSADGGDDGGATATAEDVAGDADPDADASEDEPDAFDDEENEVEGDADAGDIEDDIEDDDARQYQCGNCGHELPYLGGDEREDGGKECPECGERIWWSRVPSPEEVSS